MKSSLLKRRLARLEANSEILAKTVERERIAEALSKLSDDELERLYQRTLADLDANCDLNISHSGDVCTLTVDELVAFYRSEIEGVTEEIGTNAS